MLIQLLYNLVDSDTIGVDFVKRPPDNTDGGLRDVLQLDRWTRPMAENESLDLNSPCAQRWNVVRDVIRKGASHPEILAVTRATLRRAVRKVLVELQVYGVTTADFLAARDNPKALRNLLRKAKGHPYAELLIGVLDSSPGIPNTECLKRWGDAILDTVFGQIRHSIPDTNCLPSFFESSAIFREVHDGLTPDLKSMAIKLVDNPDWKPSVRGKTGEPKVDSTTALLSMSLMGGAIQ